LLHRKSVVETESWAKRQPKPVFVLALHALVYIRVVIRSLLFEDRRESRARIFGIDIDPPGENRLLANVGAR
jgi:hypothetical protein